MPFVRVNHFYKSASPGQTIEVSQEEADLIISRGGGVLLPDSAAPLDTPPAQPSAPVDLSEPQTADVEADAPEDVPAETIEVAETPAADADSEPGSDDDSDPIDVLAGHGLSGKVLAALAEADIRTLAELRQIEDLTDVTGIGKVTAAKIAEALARHEQR